MERGYLPRSYPPQNYSFNMNGYELHIQGTDGWKQADLGGEIPVMNYQVNDIAELKDRQAEYSQALKLPKTPNNVRIFEHAGCFDIVTGFPYRRHNCRIYCDERTVAGDGSLLLLQKVSDTFECQIISGNANFFETLQNTKMSGLDLGTYRICNASTNPDAWHPAYKLAFSLDIVPDSYPDLYADHIYKYISSPFVKYPVVSIPGCRKISSYSKNGKKKSLPKRRNTKRKN
jgi:hypothetical protein